MLVGKTLPAYLFVLLSIAALRLVAPACIIYLLACLWFLHPLGTKWLLIPTGIEAAFFLFVYLPRRFVLQSKAALSPPCLSREEREKLFDRCMHYIPEEHRSTYPAGWFLSKSKSAEYEVRRENVIEWLLFALFNAQPEDARPEWESEMNSYIRRIEEIRGAKLPEGRYEGAKSMRVNFDSVPMVHRPLVWYIIVAGVDHFTAFSLWLLGFKHYDSGGILKVFPPRPYTLFSRKPATKKYSYWYRPAVVESDDPKPTVVLIHGIGIGIFPYVPFIREILQRDPNQSILLVEIMQISMRMTAPIPSRQETLDALAAIFETLKLQRVVLVANSYGTLVASTILRLQNSIRSGGSNGAMKDHPLNKISHFVMIDLVSCLLHLPDLAMNFVYRRPKEAYEWTIWYFSSRDADVSRTLSRHFYWQETVLWKEDLADVAQNSTTPSTHKKRKVAVVLGEEDCIIDAPQVKRYITGKDDSLDSWISEDGSVELLNFPGLDHAAVFAQKSTRTPLIDLLERYTTDI